MNVDTIRAAKLISSAKQIVAFTGAGISTPSGIPDFRSKSSGLWQTYDPLQVASIQGFRRNPQDFFDWVRPLIETTMSAEPNPAHKALVDLERLGILHAIITQNIDMLHTRAGSSLVIELHGHMREATCIHCFAKYDGHNVISTFVATDEVPRCEKCKGVLKPNVILFGEQLPYKQVKLANDATMTCDLMIVIGSSLEVYPASDLPLVARRNGAKIIILNMNPTHLDEIADVIIRADVATILPEIVGQLETIE